MTQGGIQHCLLPIQWSHLQKNVQVPVSLINTMAYIFDVDWTLTTGWPYPPTWKEKPNHATINTLRRLSSQGNNIFILTGRHEKFRKLTTEWLKKQWVTYDALFMNDDDGISSTTYKRQKIQRILAPGRKIHRWYDNNPWVEKIAKELNLPFILIR